MKYWKNFELISYTEITKVRNDYSWHDEPTMEMAGGELPHALANHMAFSFFVHKIYIGKKNKRKAPTLLQFLTYTVLSSILSFIPEKEKWLRVCFLVFI